MISGHAALHKLGIDRRSCCNRLFPFHAMPPSKAHTHRPCANAHLWPSFPPPPSFKPSHFHLCPCLWCCVSFSYPHGPSWLAAEDVYDAILRAGARLNLPILPLSESIAGLKWDLPSPPPKASPWVDELCMHLQMFRERLRQVKSLSDHNLLQVQL